MVEAAKKVVNIEKQKQQAQQKQGAQAALMTVSSTLLKKQNICAIM